MLLEVLKGMQAGGDDIFSGDGGAQLQSGLTTLRLTVHSTPKNGEERGETDTGFRGLT